ncbi:MAG: dTDP-4-dehydrorhamnose 3,5-epimerase family protein [Acidobacteria bacterium]|jgi:dTDP-4-dehydrorhamnose 3,5-epimerase|nr:dTDP-4-dehydrorhamnose 3,5-epimerase family protein [Acidobacteriota bacterium]
MIEGVVVRTLEPKTDDRGRVVELFRCDGPAPHVAAQIHLTTVFPGVVKAWHRHRRRTDTLAVVSGLVRLGLYDAREGSKTENELNQFFLGDHAPLAVTVPAGVWFGMKGCGTAESLVIVVTDRPHDPKLPDEDRIDPVLNEIPFDWERRDR